MVFIPALIYALFKGHMASWLKTFNYLTVRTNKIDMPVGAKARIIWLHVLYAYTHAYVRLMLMFLIIAVVLVIFRLMLSFAPQDERKDSETVVTIVTAITEICDARSMMEFLGPRHWVCHGVAFGIYITVAFTLVYIQLSSSKISNDEIAQRQHALKSYTRAAIVSSVAMIVFYIVYACKIILST